MAKEVGRHRSSTLNRVTSRRSSLTRFLARLAVLLAWLFSPGAAHANVVSFSSPTELASPNSFAWPNVHAGASGEYLATWVADNDNLQILRSNDAGATWLPHGTIDGSSLNSSGINIVKGVGSVWLAIASSYDDFGGSVGNDLDIVFSRSTDNGSTWTPAAILNSSAGSDTNNDVDQQPMLARTGPTSWLAVWVAFFRGNLYDVLNWRIACATSNDDGLTWSTTADCIPLGDGIRDVKLDLASDPNGTVVLVWREGNGWGPLRSAHSSDRGLTWSAPQNLDSDGLPDSRSRPRVATDGAGTWILAKVSRGLADSSIGGHLVVRRSTDGGMTWGPEVTMHPNLNFRVLFGLDESPAISYSAADDTWMLVWEQRGFGFPLLELDIGYSLSHDGGLSWTLPAVANANGSNDGQADIAPHVAAGIDGGWVLVWQGGNGSVNSALAMSDCPLLPSIGCKSPIATGKALLELRNPPGAKDQIKWKWSAGQATTLADFGSPDLGDRYVVCIYDQQPEGLALVLEKDIPSTSSCASIACWEQTNKGFRYRDRGRQLSSTTKLDLRTGVDGRAKIQLFSKGSSVAPPALPLTAGATATMQLLNASTGACWEARYSAPKKNSDSRYKARSD